MSTFVPGHFAPVSWQKFGGTLGLLNVKQHDLTLSVLLHDVTGVKAGGVRARIPGPSDCEGRVMCDFDLDEPPYLDPPLLIPGIKGVASFGLAPTRGIQVPLIIEQLHFSSATDQEVKWDFTAKMNSLAGFVVFPPL